MHALACFSCCFLLLLLHLRIGENHNFVNVFFSFLLFSLFWKPSCCFCFLLHLLLFVVFQKKSKEALLRFASFVFESTSLHGRFIHLEPTFSPITCTHLHSFESNPVSCFTLQKACSHRPPVIFLLFFSGISICS